jgi:hypothetical protein
MNQDEFDIVWRGLCSVWPRAFDRDDDGELRTIWRSFFIAHDYTRVVSAVRGWMAEHRNAPSIADVREAIRASAAHLRPATSSYAERAGTRCGLCDRGWVEHSGSAPFSPGTVTRCPNGCIPPKMSMAQTAEH